MGCEPSFMEKNKAIIKQQEKDGTKRSRYKVGNN